MKVVKKYSGIGGGHQTPDRLIIHSMGEKIVISRSDSDWYKKNKKIDIKQGVYHADEFLRITGLSPHFLLCPDGTFIKLRKTTEIGWHAKGHNKNTIGIEVLVEGNHNYHTFLKKIKTDFATKEQMNALIEMSNGIIEYFDISHDNVVRHSDIDPKRKHDVGSGFDWKYFKSKLI